MEEVYLYFRTQGTIGSDQDSNDSACFPMSSFAGYEATSAGGVNQVKLYFKSMINANGMDQANNSVTISDFVVLNLKSTAKHIDFLKAFNQQVYTIGKKQNKFFMVADDLSTDTTYFSTLLDSVGAITIAAAHA